MPSAPRGSQAEKQAYQLAECQKRVERFPTDLQFRFELGELYFQAGKFSEAIQEFQRAQANPHKRIAAMNYLGQCFGKKKATCDMAVRKFQEALKEKPVFDNEKKELIYNLAGVLETLGKKAEAIEQLKLIYEVDIGYKDVMARVNAFYARPRLRRTGPQCLSEIALPRSAVFVPKGHSRIAQRFNAGFRSHKTPSPEGTAESRPKRDAPRTRPIQPSLRDGCNTKLACPSVETLGYCRSVPPGQRPA